MKTPEIYKPYGMRHAKPQLICPTGMTKQNMAAECDINAILRKYQKTGAITHMNEHEPSYGEITSIELKDAMDITTSAQSMFNELPSSIRNQFNNDPGQFLDFIQDPKNNEEAADLGLAERKPTEAPPKNEGSAKQDTESTGQSDSKASASGSGEKSTANSKT